MFIEKNESFTCIVCGTEVAPHPSSSRDHCTNCLSSLHVDIEPGDRRNECTGVLQPIGIETKEGKMQIVYRCETCGMRHKNIVAPDDNTEMIIELSTKIMGDPSLS